ncbi:hypothetical protein Hanom_Chr06g00553761 [Helianthus anomalus]
MLMTHSTGTYLHRILSTSITARGHSREWCTSNDHLFFYYLLYMRPCALAHGLAQYFAFAHHRQERRFLYGGAYVTVIARSLGLLSEADPHLLPTIEPTRMGFQMLRGMKLIKRFDLLGERFKTRGGHVFVSEELLEHFDPVYPLPDHARVVQEPSVDLGGAAMPQPPPPPRAPQFPQHVIPSHASGAVADPRLRADVVKLMDLMGWLVQRRRIDEREGGLPVIPLPHINNNQIQSKIHIQTRRHIPAACSYFGI